MEKVKVALVCLYGCNTNSVGLKKHLHNVSRVGLQEDIKFYILSGGQTQQRRFPGITEASAAYEYLKHRVPEDSSFCLEEDSFTTYDNIKNSADWINNFPFEVGEIFVFVEAIRSLRVSILCRNFLPGFFPGRIGRNIRIETASWEQKNPLDEFTSTLKTCLAIQFPHLAEIEKRKKMEISKYQ